jgi:hypothetical protein
MKRTNSSSAATLKVAKKSWPILVQYWTKIKILVQYWTNIDQYWTNIDQYWSNIVATRYDPAAIKHTDYEIYIIIAQYGISNGACKRSNKACINYYNDTIERPKNITL